MHLFSINDIFSAPLVKALCRTLVNSLWIGIVLTVITGVIMLSTKRNTAALRYNLLTGAFISFVITMMIVFAAQITTAVPETAQAEGLVPAAKISTDAAMHPSVTGEKENITVTINNFLNDYANVIVLAWFLVIVFRSIKFAGGIRKIYKLKHAQLSAAGDTWDEKLSGFAQRLRIKRSVKFFQSGIATIPMVVGHFKPVILFPLGLLASLPPAEIEAILIHELAHIERKDFLVNMLQHLAEILFFFNPAVLWVSSLIKIERENCCDDIAVANTGNKRNYINALVSFQEYHLINNQYAPALADTKKHLLKRVKRMLYNNTGSLNNREKTFLTICFAAVASMTIFFSNAGIVSKNKIFSSASPASDSIVSIAARHYDPAAFKEGNTMVLTEKIKGVTHILRIFKREGALYEIYDDIKSFKINGVKIPQAEWGKYNELMASLMKQTNSTKAIIAEQQKADAALDADNKQRVIDNRQGAIDNKQRATDNGQQAIDNKQRATDNGQQAADSRTADMDSKTSEADSKASAEDSKMIGPDHRDAATAEKQAAIDKKDAMQQKKQADADRAAQKISKRKIEWKESDGDKVLLTSTLSYSVNTNTGTVPYVSSANDYKKNGAPINYNNYTSAPASSYNAYKPEATTTAGKKSYTLSGVQYTTGSLPEKDIDIKTLTQNFISDLTSANVISGTTGLSYKMSAESLIVNGVMQPEAIHQQLKNKYIQSEDRKLLYNWKETR